MRPTRSLIPTSPWSSRSHRRSPPPTRDRDRGGTPGRQRCGGRPPSRPDARGGRCPGQPQRPGHHRPRARARAPRSRRRRCSRSRGRSRDGSLVPARPPAHPHRRGRGARAGRRGPRRPGDRPMAHGGLPRVEARSPRPRPHRAAAADRRPPRRCPWGRAVVRARRRGGDPRRRSGGPVRRRHDRRGDRLPGPISRCEAAAIDRLEQPHADRAPGRRSGQRPGARTHRRPSSCSSRPRPSRRTWRTSTRSSASPTGRHSSQHEPPRRAPTRAENVGRGDPMHLADRPGARAMHSGTAPTTTPAVGLPLSEQRTVGLGTRPPRCEPTRTPTVARRCDQRFRRPVAVQLGCRRTDTPTTYTGSREVRDPRVMSAPRLEGAGRRSSPLVHVRHGQRRGSWWNGNDSRSMMLSGPVPVTDSRHATFPGGSSARE